jgi:hypothetical protein
MVSKNKQPKCMSWSCTRCPNTYIISSKDQYLYLMKKTMPCIRYGCTGELKQGRKTKGSSVHALALYQAALGVGLDDERKCPPSKIKKLLIGKKITHISLSSSPDKDRSILESITLEGDMTIHLAPSTKGVTVFKVTKNG